MATSTTNRGKTKTSKRTTSKTSTKRAVTTKTAKVSASKKLTKRNFLTTSKILAYGILLSIALAVAVGFLMQPNTYQVTLAHLTNDALLSQNNTAFITANRPVADIELRWAVVGLLVVSSVLPALYLTKLKKYYSERVAKGRVLELRWADLAVTSTLMIMIIGLIIGVQDIMLLKLLGAFMITTCALGWLAERQNAKAGKPEWSAFNISILTGLMPWVVIGTTKVATLFYGAVRSPWYVYAACIVALFGFIMLALNQRNSHRRFKAAADYAVVERNYVTIGLLTRLSFVGILLIGLAK